MYKMYKESDSLKAEKRYYSGIRNFDIASSGIMAIGAACGTYSTFNLVEPKALPAFIIISGTCLIGSAVTGYAAHLDNRKVKEVKAELTEALKKEKEEEKKYPGFQKRFEAMVNSRRKF